jgi:hypothetical protein
MKLKRHMLRLWSFSHGFKGQYALFEKEENAEHKARQA